MIHIKAITFDLYNTLARFWPSREQIQEQACHHFGIEVTLDGVARGYAWADAFMARVNGERPLRQLGPQETEEFFSEYQRLVLLGSSVEVAPEEALRIWERVKNIPHGLVLYGDVKPALEHLRKLQLRLGVISNLNSDGWTLSADLGLTPYIDFIVTPKEIGVEKPHPRIFRAALESTGFGADRVLHVGDQYTSDVLGARRMGMYTVLMDRYGTQEQELDCPVVADMSGLIALVHT